ncbi:MAG: acyltransferase [Flavobacterium sp.]|nr:acyltransferase [Flavobacterium sp.]
MHHKNNFDFLRLMFAIFVIISHSYPLTGNKSAEFLMVLTNGRFELSDFSVKGFFVISGFLIFQSMVRSKSVINYLWKRILRLFPGLLVVLLLTIILAPLVYESQINYFDNHRILSYVYKNISLFRLQYIIPGVFENNIYGRAINDSLWTICYEFSLYFVMILLFVIRKKTFILNFAILFLLMPFSVFYFQKDHFGVYNFYQLSTNLLSELGIYFFMGSLLASLNIQELKNKYIFTAICIVILFLNEIFITNYMFIRFLIFPILIILIGTQSTKYINSFSQKTGDLSYGVYIYAFPIQQTLMCFFILKPLQLMLLSIPITLLFVYLSWHIIEKKALEFKNLNLLSILKLNKPQYSK